MVEVIVKGLGANSKKPRETGRAFLTASHAGVVFPAPRVPTPPPPPGTFLQLFNCATTLDACQLHDCVVAAERGGHSTSDGPDTPLHRTPVGLKSFDDRHHRR
jgi:hypothetical protein